MRGAALALAQAVAVRTPETTSQLVAGYAAIAVVLAAYGIYLWRRAARAKAGPGENA